MKTFHFTALRRQDRSARATGMPRRLRVNYVLNTPVPIHGCRLLSVSMLHSHINPGGDPAADEKSTCHCLYTKVRGQKTGGAKMSAVVDVGREHVTRTWTPRDPVDTLDLSEWPRGFIAFYCCTVQYPAKHWFEVKLTLALNTSKTCVSKKTLHW